MRRDEYMSLTPGERAHMEWEMNYEPAEEPQPEIGECLHCGKEYVVKDESDYCSDEHALVAMLEYIWAMEVGH